MSSAFYPLGMNTYNNRLPQGGYKPQKATGVFSNPTGITSGNIRPLTNNDVTNDAPAPFGKPRPIKHYRRGISTGDNSNREVKSSVQDKMVQAMLDNPGRYTLQQNVNPNYPYVGNMGANTIAAQADITAGGPYLQQQLCNNFGGVAVVSNYKPINDLTNSPQPNVMNPNLCCNQQRKAKRRAIYASTNLKKNYYTDTYQYLYNRCQTYDQRVFNFVKGLPTVQDYQAIISDPNLTEAEIAAAKPGSPLSYLNYYVANCNPNGVVEQSLINAFIYQSTLLLLNNGIIDQTQFDAIVGYNFTTLVDLINYLNTLLDTDNYNAALQLIEELLRTPEFNQLPTYPKGCSRVYYKPNNPQFAQQGGVSSSTRIFKLNVDTISTNAASIGRTNTYMYKNKAPGCTNKVCVKKINY